MAKTGQKFVAYQGDDIRLTIPIVDEDGDPYTMTGFTSTQAVWKLWDPNDENDNGVPSAFKISYDLDGQLSVVNSAGTDDAIQVDILGSDTDLPVTESAEEKGAPKSYKWELWLTDNASPARTKSSSLGTMELRKSQKV